MQKLFIVVLTLCGAASGVACPSGYAWIDTVTVAAQGSLSGNLTNQSSLFIGSDTGFQTTGGHVLHSTWPLDIVPCTGPGTGTVIPFEIVPNSYSATGGTFEMWLNLPAINKSSTTTFYIMVGNSSPSDLTCNQNNTAGCSSVFTSCKVVLHQGYNNGSTNAQVFYDSCAATAGTNHSSTAFVNTTFPPVYEGSTFGSQTIDSGVAPGALSNATLRVWVNNTDSSTNHGFVGHLSSNVGIDMFTFTGSTCTALTHCWAYELGTSAGNNRSDFANYDIGNVSTWKNLAVTYPTGGCGGTAGKMCMYGNGVLLTNVSNFLTGSPTTPGSSGVTLSEGCGGTGCTANWTGKIDEVQEYSVAWTVDQLLWGFTVENNPTAQYTNSFAAAGASRHRAWVIQTPGE